MPKLSTLIVWILVLTGLFGVLFSNWATDRDYFYYYKSAIEIYLFGFTAYLVLKHIFFYRFKGNVDVIRLVKESNFRAPLLIQGLVLTLMYLGYTFYYYDSLMHFNSIMIAILLLFYVVQLFMDSNPSIYIDEEYFAYDDYFVERWAWRDIQRIELENNMLRLVSEEDSFELDFNLVDEIDYIKLNDEVAYEILDGDFASEKDSRTLVEIVQTYANLYNVRLVNSMDRVI